MSAIRDLAGQKFNRLTVLSIVGRDSRGRATWLCRCECGNTVVARSYKLVSGKTKSCGCRHKEAARENGKASGTHGMHLEPEYSAWHSMKGRCLNPNHHDFHNYGGRGITVCERWLKFENFYADMGKRPEGKSLDRFPNNDGNYEPGNCRWATPKEQSNNRRSNVFIEFGAVRKTKTEWAREIGISFESLCKRLKKWSLERALTEKPTGGVK